MRRLKYFIVCLLIIALYAQTPSFQWFKSIAVMSVYSTYEANRSVLHDEGVEINIPGGMTTSKNDWYPFVITFNDDQGFSRYTGRDLRMTVLYNFGHYPFYRGYASYYDVQSPYYNSFYGAYAVKTAEGEPFGFSGGVADVVEMGMVPTFDMEYLVLVSIGEKNPEFSYEVTRFEGTELLGENEWQVFDADMRVSGAMHTYEKDYRAYIQYGRPPYVDGTIADYEVIDMKGRIYGKHYEEKDISIFFYCITTDTEVIEEWERTIMAHSEVIFK